MKLHRSFYIFFVFLLFPVYANSAPGKVYIIKGSDSAVWNTPGGLKSTPLYNSYDTADPVYCSSTGSMAQVMDSTYRDQHRDSYGNPIKFTWWMLGGGEYRYGLNCGPWLAFELVTANWYSALTSSGDELAFHYHTWTWADYNNDSVYYWNEAKTFAESSVDFDISLAELILDFNIYPPSFRSGWNSMYTDWENYLDKLIPYRLCNQYPGYSNDTIEPISFVDWRFAPAAWVPYHPSDTNYQIVGNLNGWETRCENAKGGYLSQANINSIFSTANAGTDEVVCVWSHCEEPDFATQMATIHVRLTTAWNLYPAVNWEYCTALDGYKKWLKIIDNISPMVTLYQQTDATTRNIYFKISEPFYQPKPFVAGKTKSNQVVLLNNQLISITSTLWKTAFNRFDTGINRIGFGGTDTAGNPVAVSQPLENNYIDTVPRITVLEPNGIGDSANSKYCISWDAQDYDNNALISLYYDTDSIGWDGTLIVSELSEDSINSYVWNTSGVPAGNYYVYALINDSTNPTGFSYSQGKITITHTSGDTIPPNAAVLLSAITTVSGRVNLVWSRPAPASDSDLPVYYRIYRSLSSSGVATAGNYIGRTVDTATTWVDANIPNTSPFYYSITGIDDSSNESIGSNFLSVTPKYLDRISPSIVTTLQANTTGFLQIRLDWKTPALASDGGLPTSYHLYRSKYPPVDYTDPGLSIVTVSAVITTYTDSNLSAYTTYYYTLTTLDNNGNESLGGNQVAATCGIVDLIIDNLDPGFSTPLGTWNTGSTTLGGWGPNYRWHYVDTTANSALTQWTPVFSNSGDYEVFVWYNNGGPGDNRATNAPYTVKYSGGDTTIRVDQQLNGSSWYSLGVYSFGVGSNAYVSLSNNCPGMVSSKVVIGDAVRFLMKTSRFVIPVELVDFGIEPN
jgi:hypothetical protein